MNGLLDRIVAAKRRAHAERKPVLPATLWHDVVVRSDARPLAMALRKPGRQLRVIAEFKRRSPSAGEIRPGADPAAIAGEYAAAGASALSVLTDGEFFGAEPGDLGRAQQACALPVLRKDFLLDERDLLETRIAGADAALLIVRLLPEPLLSALIEVGERAGLSLLVEAHTDAEVETALRAGAQIIGVNHRDLDTLTIDLQLSARARKLAGSGPILVGESGIGTAEHMALMVEHGVDAVLVGESLLRSPSPGAKLRELLA